MLHRGDVIVGFPGETEADFQETVSFLKDLEISYLHVFTYSERANTPANEMGNPVPMHIRKERNEILRQLSEKKKRAFYLEHLGQQRIVLVEQSKTPKHLTGFTDNYIKVSLDPSEVSVNGLFSVKLHEINEHGLVEVA